MNSKKKIMLVDDEIDLIEIYADLLTAKGYDVDLAQAGLEARELILAGHYDLVISDIRMPDIDGIELMQLIKSKIPDLGFIIISGFSDYNENEILQKGAFKFLHKPLKSVNLTSSVTEYFSQIKSA